MRPLGTVFIVRGLAGSGKSIVSSLIASGNFDGDGLEPVITSEGHRYMYDRENEVAIVSSDFYCVDPNDMTLYPNFKGAHSWDREKMVEVNEKAQRTFDFLIDNGNDTIIVDQPNLNPRDCIYYVSGAHRAKMICINVEPQAPYNYDLLADRAQRDIDRGGIAASNKRYEPMRYHPDSLGRKKD
jgi:hypothetical protein